MTLSLQCAEVGPQVAEALLDRIRLASTPPTDAAAATTSPGTHRAVPSELPGRLWGSTRQVLPVPSMPGCVAQCSPWMGY